MMLRQITGIPILMLMLIVGLTNCLNNGKIKSVVDVIEKLKNQMNVNCLYLIHHTDITGNYAAEDVSKNRMEMMKLRKLLSEHQMQAGGLFEEPTSQYGCNRPFYVIESSNSTATKSMLQKLTEKINMGSAEWLLLMDGDKSIDEAFAEVNIPFDCKFLVAKRVNSVMSLFAVYRAIKSHPLQITNWVSSFEFYTQRNNLHGIIFKGAVMDGVALKLSEGENGLQVDGLFGQVWKVLEQHLNFSTEFVRPPDNSYGSELTYKNWSGMVGMVMKHEADMAVADMVMNPGRVPVIDFIAPILQQRTYMFISMVLEDINWTSLMHPFSSSLWFTIIFTVIFTVICLYAINYLRQRHHLTPCYSQHDPLLLFILGSVCNQGHPFTPQSLSCRIVCLTSYLNAVVFFAAYSASLVSHLASKTFALPFDTFEEFLSDDSYTLDVYANSAHLDYFKNSNNPLMKQIYDSKIAPHEKDLPRTFEEGFRRICELHKYSFMSPSFIALSLWQELTCPIVAVPHICLPGTSAMIIAKNSPYLGILRHNIQKMHSSGILKKIQLSTMKQKLPPAETAPLVVTLQDVLPLIVLLTLGVAIAFLFLIIEKLYKAVQQFHDTAAVHTK